MHTFSLAAIFCNLWSFSISREGIPWSKHNILKNSKWPNCLGVYKRGGGFELRATQEINILRWHFHFFWLRWSNIWRQSETGDNKAWKNTWNVLQKWHKGQAYGWCFSVDFSWVFPFRERKNFKRLSQKLIIVLYPQISQHKIVSFLKPQPRIYS